MSKDFEGPRFLHSTNEFADQKAWPDSIGNWPNKLDTKFVGKTYFHPGTGNLYSVVGIVFQAEEDRWELAYQKQSATGLPKGPLCTHRPEDFEREGRFLEVKK